MKKVFLILLMLVVLILSAELTYPVVDTNQFTYYDNTSEISMPYTGEPFYGQDASYSGNQPSYTDNEDGTIADNVTGLIWQKTPDQNGDGTINYDDKMSYAEALEESQNCSTGGYNDWRLPNIKELYSLIIFSGIDPSGNEAPDPDDLIPFINTDYFDFAYGDTQAGERIIDAQFASSTLYIGTTMNDDETMFGVNFADGRIKGYPIGPMPGQQEDKQFYVLYVRENPNYSQNDFSNNSDGTITDNATGLMWTHNDSGQGFNWQEALNYAENDEIAGYSDWRLPNAKELQSIVDYSQAPSVTGNPAIDPIFSCSSITAENGNTDYPFYWTGTTHANWTENENGIFAVYVCFGTAFGYMNQWIDVHGAGAQRSDLKTGNPEDWPQGHGPQGDAVRIYNYVRLVRDAGQTPAEDNENISPQSSSLQQNYPNPFNPSTRIDFSIYQPDQVELTVYNFKGQKVSTLFDEFADAGDYSITWSATDQQGKKIPSGIYFYTLSSSTEQKLKKMLLLQ